MDMVQVYGAALERTGRIVAGIERDQRTAKTPCARYDVRALTNHLVGGFAMWVEMADGKPVEFAERDVLGDDWTADYERGAAAARQAFERPGVLQRTFRLPNGAEVPGEQALGIALMEAAVHGWDLAVATGQDASIDEALAAALLPGFQAMGLPRSEDGNPFGPEVPVTKDERASSRLLGFLGRTP